MAAAVTIAPIATDKVEDWRAFLAELKGARRTEWAQSQRRRGITKQVITIGALDPPVAVVYTKTDDATQADARLASFPEPFDIWFREQVTGLHGDPYETEVVFDSSPRRGPWRGWRR